MEKMIDTPKEKRDLEKEIRNDLKKYKELYKKYLSQERPLSRKGCKEILDLTKKIRKLSEGYNIPKRLRVS